MIRSTTLSFIALLLLSSMSCAHLEAERVRTSNEWNESTHPLHPGAEKIEVVEYLSQDKRDQLVDVGLVKCEKCLNQKTLRANQRSCMNNLRNQALKMGGSFVVVNEGWETLTGDPITNCVNVKGLVYKKKF